MYIYIYIYIYKYIILYDSIQISGSFKRIFGWSMPENLWILFWMDEWYFGVSTLCLVGKFRLGHYNLGAIESINILYLRTWFLIFTTISLDHFPNPMKWWFSFCIVFLRGYDIFGLSLQRRWAWRGWATFVQIGHRVYEVDAETPISATPNVMFTGSIWSQ